MKKTFWIVLGCVAVAALLLLSRKPEEPEPADEQVVETPTAEKPQVKATGELLANPEPEESLEERAKKSSAAVRTIIDKDMDYQTRQQALGLMGYEISPEDLAVLMEFLETPMPEDSGMPAGIYNTLRNNILNMLMAQKELPEGAGAMLVQCYENEAQDPMWRNYCLQFMRDCYELKAEQAVDENSTSADPASPDELAVMQESLWLATDERDNSNAGTALLALDKLSRNYEEFDRSRIEASMLDLAADDNATVANRVTALRLCGEQGVTAAAETARDLAENGDSIMLRCAAIVTLGELGTEEDRTQLESYTSGGHPRLTKAAETALKKMGQADSQSM